MKLYLALGVLVIIIGGVFVNAVTNEISLSNELLAKGFPSLRERVGLGEGEYLVLTKEEVDAWSPQQVS